MEKRTDYQKYHLVGEEEEEEVTNKDEELVSTLPKLKYWDDRYYFYNYQGFWFLSKFFDGVISFQRQFQAQESDVMLTSFPKCGTTWLKALTFSIMNRSRYALEESPLLTNTPHDLIPILEIDTYWKKQSHALEDLPTPRILSTHLPHPLLPTSIMNSNCRIVYICRNPLDQFISCWHFYFRFRDQASEPFPFDEAFEMVCQGVQTFGPIWEHILGYWKASMEEPHRILFLKYEDLKEDINFNVKKLADFLGCPFSEEEETKGVIEKISKVCSFNHLKNLEVNKTGEHAFGAKNYTFFRKGQVGDWANYLTPSQAQRLEKLLEEKFNGSGFTFKKT